MHLQVHVEHVKVSSDWFGGCEIAGKIVRIFRDRFDLLELGKSVSFDVPCRKPGTSPRPGGTLWQSPEEVRKADFFELFLGFSTPRITIRSSDITETAGLRVFNASTDGTPSKARQGKVRVNGVEYANLLFHYGSQAPGCHDLGAATQLTVEPAHHAFDQFSIS